MKVIYVGPHQDGWIDVEPPITFERGVPLDVPDDVAARILVQDTWEAAPADKPTKKDAS